MSILRKAWDRWKIIGGIVGNYQGRFIATAFYYTILAPFGAGVALFSDPMRLKKKSASSVWVEREPVKAELEDARRMF